MLKLEKLENEIRHCQLLIARPVFFACLIRAMKSLAGYNHDHEFSLGSKLMGGFKVGERELSSSYVVVGFKIQIKMEKMCQLNCRPTPLGSY